MLRGLRVVPAILAALGAHLGCTSETAEPAEEAGCTDAPGVLCTWAGTGRAAFDGDGHALTESSFYWPVDLTIDPELGTFVLDWNNHRVRRLTDDGTFETVIGSDFVGDGPDDLSDLEPPGAPGTEVLLNHPTQLVANPDGSLTLVAWHNHKLRRYDPATGLVRVVCGSAAGFDGDGGPAADAKLNQPSHMVLGDDGSEYVLDQRNQVIRRIASDGTIDTIAGTPMEPGFEGDGGPALQARFSFPTGSNPPPGGGLALDGRDLYVADSLNHRIRKVDLDSGEISTVAGTGEAGFSGDGGPALQAQINFPRKLTLGPDGRLYFGDQENNRIRAIDLDSGRIDTVVGNGERGFDGDGRDPRDSALDRPTGVAFDEQGALYVIDTFNSRIRRVLPEED